MKSPEHERRNISEYVETQASGEKVSRAEKITTEKLRSDSFDIWDVQTDKDRYWVITSPTNLYSHNDFPSMDYALSFHIGLMNRLSADQHSSVTDEEIWRTPKAWRQWEQAHIALDDAVEAEDYQAVGVRCREVLITLTEELATHEITSAVNPEIKKSDVKNQLNEYFNILAPGDSMKVIRSYMKTNAEKCWELVGWLTHHKNAIRDDAQFVMNATEQLMLNALELVVRTERPLPERCPICSSYQMTRDFRSELIGVRDPYVKLCESCGWAESYT